MCQKFPSGLSESSLWWSLHRVLPWKSMWCVIQKMTAPSESNSVGQSVHSLVLAVTLCFFEFHFVLLKEPSILSSMTESGLQWRSLCRFCPVPGLWGSPSACVCLWGGTQPLGLNQWGHIMFSPFSVINSNHPSVASPMAANTSKSRPRRNFSSLLNLNLSACLSVKTEQREENWNQCTGSEVSINVRERQVCLDCKLLLADGLTILQLEIAVMGGGGGGQLLISQPEGNRSYQLL